MAGSVIGALRVNLGLDSAQFQTGTKEAGSAMDKLKSKFSLGGAAIAAAAVAAATAVVAFGIKSASAIDVTAKSARRLGESIEGFRAMELAAGEAGVDVGSLTDGVQTMNRELAKGGKGSASALRQLGIDAADFKKQRPSEQLATLADAIQKTGATSGEASALLQSLGVRNKEMILALVSGGAIFRDAAKDIADYGLALSDIDAASIEKANDQMGRLSLIGQYLGDQIALAVVPAFGALAQVMTDSLREGGLLRAVLDAISGAIRVVVEITSAAVNIITSMASAIGGLIGWVYSTTDGFFGLGGAIESIWGALTSVIDWAYDLITGFSALITAAGSFGNAMSLLADVAVEVWQRIGDGVSYVTNSVAAMSAKIDAYFIAGLRRMAGAWVDFTWAIADGLNSLFGTSLTGASAVITQELGKMETAANGVASASTAAATAAGAAFSAPLKSVQALKDAVASSKAEVEATIPPVNELGDALDSAGGKGSSAGKKIKDSLTEVQKAANTGADAIGGMFSGLLDGSKSLRESIADLIMDIAKMQLMNGFKSLFGADGPFSGVGSWLGSLLGKNAAGTEHWKGGLTTVNERGGEIMDLPNGTRIIPHDVSNAMMASSGSSGGTSISIDARGAQQGVAEQIAAQMQKALPDIVNATRASIGKRQSRGYAV
jgi:hypothetical protein